MSSAWQYISASRLEAPITLVGFTALSVEISTIACAPAARAASATMRVPAALVSRPSSGLASTIGTCFSAAAWNTSSGRNSSTTARMRASSRMSASTARRGTDGVALAQFQVDLPQRELAVVEQHQHLGAEGGHLPRQFAADRAARAGHQHAAALHQPRHALAVERHLRAVQQVLDGDRPQFQPLRRCARPRSSAVGPRCARHPQPVALGHLHQRGQHRRRACRARSPPAPPAGAARARSRSSTAAASATLPRIGQPWMRRPVCACPSDSRPVTRYGASRSPASARRNRSAPSPAPTSSTGCAAVAAGGAFLQQPVEHARHRQQHHQWTARAARGRSARAARHLRLVQHQREQGGGGQAGGAHAEQVAGAGEAPVLHRQPERQARQQQRRRRPGQRPCGRGRVGRGASSRRASTTAQAASSAVQRHVDGDAEGRASCPIAPL